ncbi:MAG TPA: hypothetical protein VIC07_13555 [Acidimicrobiia bacterium]
MTDNDRPPTGISGSEMAAGIGVMFAATMMIVVGIFQIFQGLAAIMNDEFFVPVADYVLDASSWGWVHLILGVVVTIAGFYLFSGSRAAAILAMTFASLSAVANFAFIPFFPFWSVLIIAVDVFVIWAITKSSIWEE